MWAFGYGAREVTSDRRSGNFPFKSINGKSLYSKVSQVSLPNKPGEGTVSRRHGDHYAVVPVQYTVFLTTDVMCAVTLPVRMLLTLG